MAVSMTESTVLVNLRILNLTEQLNNDGSLICLNSLIITFGMLLSLLPPYANRATWTRIDSKSENEIISSLQSWSDLSLHGDLNSAVSSLSHIVLMIILTSMFDTRSGKILRFIRILLSSFESRPTHNVNSWLLTKASYAIYYINLSQKSAVVRPTGI